MDNMLQHLFHPIPDLSSQPPPPADEVQRLQTIITNLDAQHNAVRSRIITSARAALATQLEAQARSAENSPNSPSSADLSSKPGLAHLLATLGGSTRSPAAVNSPQTAQSPATKVPLLPAPIPQVPTPPEVQIALQTLRELQEYTANAIAQRNRYAIALQKLQTSDPTQQRRLSIPATTAAQAPSVPAQTQAQAPARDPRTQSRPRPPAVPAKKSWGLVQPFSRNQDIDDMDFDDNLDGANEANGNGAGNVDANRDPRRRRSSISAAAVVASGDVDPLRDPRMKAR